MNNSPDLQRDLAIIAKQEERLLFNAFDNVTAWQLGESIKKHCEPRNLAVTIEIRFCRETVFFYAMPGTSPNNSDWARRKRNTVELLQQSSYAVGLRLSQETTTLEEKQGLATRDFAAHGGSFPIRVANNGCVGAVTISGLPQREDHNVVVLVIAGLIGVSMDGISLP